jgi:2-polyprenyl-3-methyl-5-hydroxy-6-metoxy-1,4-benzoquinol methylase
MNSCIICGNHHFELIFSNTLLKCSRCGFITANMEINKEILEAIYNVNYFRGEEYFDYLKDKEIIQLNFEWRIGYIKRAISKGIPVSNCLEIGCAYGFFGEVLKKNWNTSYKGIDVVHEAVEYGRIMLNLDLVKGDYLNMPESVKPYSDIFMWDVIEHLQFPTRFIQKVYSELATGGRIYITTGDISALLPKIQGRKWRMIHPPSHIHYFTSQNLKTLLKENGFSIIKTTHLPVIRSLRQIYHSIFILNKQETVFSKLLNFIPVSWKISLNTFDIVFIIAQKN